MASMHELAGPASPSRRIVGIGSPRFCQGRAATAFGLVRALPSAFSPPPKIRRAALAVLRLQMLSLYRVQESDSKGGVLRSRTLIQAEAW